MCRSSIKKYETEKSDQSRLSFWQGNYKFVKNLQGKEVWAQGIKLESTVVLSHSLLALSSLFLVIMMPFILLAQGGFFSHGRSMSCFQGDKGWSKCPPCTGCFLRNFNVKYSICQCSIFWGGIFCSSSKHCNYIGLDIKITFYISNYINHFSE